MIASHVIRKGKDKVTLDPCRIGRTCESVGLVEPSKDVTKPKVWIASRVGCCVLHVIPVVLSVEPVEQSHWVPENWVVCTIPELLGTIVGKIKEDDRIAGCIGIAGVKDQRIRKTSCETGQ